MSTWQVIGIVSEITLKVAPNWTWGDESGDLVMIADLNQKWGDLDAVSRATIMRKLRDLLQWKEVRLSNPRYSYENIVICDVEIEGVDVKRLIEFYYPY